MIHCLLPLIVLFGSPAHPTSDDEPFSHVDPFLGTGGYGHTFPGAVMPFGMVQLSPDTASRDPKESYPWCAGYRYEDPTILGFSHTHLSGTGHSDLGDFLVMPMVGEVHTDPGPEDRPDQGYRSRFSHDLERAEPGYYTVQLLDPDVKAELTATTRVGVHRYTFPETERAHILMDLVHAIYNFDGKVVWSSVTVHDDRVVTGYRQTTGWAPDRRIYFAAEFSKPFKSYSLTREDREHYYFRERGVRRQPVGAQTFSGRKLKLVFHFDTEANEPILLKVGISPTDVAGARRNLEKEVPHWDFERVRHEAKTAWRQELDRVRIDGDRATKQIFYTSLYHASIAPMTYCDVDGRYPGMDGCIRNAGDHLNYTVFSLWDTYRATHPLFTLIQRERVPDMIRSMVRHYEENPRKQLPIWSLHGNETYCMIGYHAVSVIGDAYLKGIRGFDVARAYQAVRDTATHPDYDGLHHYRKRGYVPIDLEPEAASKTLEYAYDDFVIAQMARALGRKADFRAFSERAKSYRNVFDPVTGFMRARLADGRFREPFDPFRAAWAGDYTEGNAWQYSWYVPHDVQGLIELMGGRHSFVTKLDRLFEVETDEEKYKEVDDISGLIGQYVHGNEPSHHIAYLYNYAGMPWRTQERIAQILSVMYQTGPEGLAGNEDCGQMSAWYLFSALGFYPVAPGDGVYVIGKPSLPRATIQLGGGKTFVVTAEDLSPENIYIQSVRLNGKDWPYSYLYHRDIAVGGSLHFEMGPEPNRAWGSDPTRVPPSMTETSKTW
ncbi:GH92 family glycosyl hydrolase [Sulfidibacter corallicola]|uniref:GH92 family glycosyl hydrolase n=1 Tax=Sulfidibacter corallicola TaxID=2818388 RepID=A0A8A4TDL0_SULCO|nr:GH92 family glycosyl hydrolase [Sulfidibacter corallicola]QTD47650.1 GH92 family glycosyl hydrolase [Sulfidibacter corallicola]